MLTKKNDSATLGNEDISTPNSRVLTKKKHQLQEHEIHERRIGRKKKRKFYMQSFRLIWKRVSRLAPERSQKRLI